MARLGASSTERPVEPIPSQFLGYATPVAKLSRANVWLALACFALIWMVSVLIIDALKGWLRQMSVLFFLASAAPAISANVAGFIIPFLLIRPYAHPQRWRPYLASAVAGALAVLLEWLFFVEATKPMILKRYAVFAAYFCGGLISTIVLFWLYRITVDRKASKGSRANA